ncbi:MULTISPECIES: SMC-Scp complex subunit ScpB [Corynebacterium]|uniref:SMC-Scp complex subunit ScpB n=1 Tax=Corynebacterium TaxID=1716 RepID=UPI001CE45950|nr:MULTISPECIES: SMC-Scp complex subunit ScpB [Corynebacterium]
MNHSEGKQPEGNILAPVSVVRSRVESLLLISDEPAQPEDLARVLNAEYPDTAESTTSASDVTADDVREVLREIAMEFDARGSGFELREQDDGWRLYTRRANAPVVEAKVLDGSQQRLSRAALETLAVIAYRQPVTRAQVSAVRGVNCDGVIRTLTVRGLIAEEAEETGVGGAHLYSTTPLFLEQLGLSSLEELPDLAPLLPEVDAIEE